MKDSHYCSPSVKKSIQNFGLMSAINKKQSKKEGKKERKEGILRIFFTLYTACFYFF